MGLQRILHWEEATLSVGAVKALDTVGAAGLAHRSVQSSLLASLDFGLSKLPICIGSSREQDGEKHHHPDQQQNPPKLQNLFHDFLPIFTASVAGMGALRFLGVSWLGRTTDVLSLGGLSPHWHSPLLPRRYRGSWLSATSQRMPTRRPPCTGRTGAKLPCPPHPGRCP